MKRDLRCPTGPHKLFARVDREQALLQVSCPNCRKTAREVYPDVAFVLHQYDVMTGAFVSTVWEWPDGLISAEGQAPLRLIS